MKLINICLTCIRLPGLDCGFLNKRLTEMQDGLITTVDCRGYYDTRKTKNPKRKP